MSLQSIDRKVAIFIVAYNAVDTLADVLGRIPKRIVDFVEEIYVIDDCSKDQTFLVGQGYKSINGFNKLNIYRNETNRGYGGNQKLGFRYAIDKGYDYIVLLHGDGQYAPEILEDLLSPLERGDVDAIFGSRMINPRQAIKGGMPFYKFVGNRILSGLENHFLEMNLSEFHSGYRIYKVDCLAQLPFHLNSDDFHFDTQIIIQYKEAGFTIIEKPIPTYYGDEICYVNGMAYAANVLKSVLGYKLHKISLVTLAEYTIETDKSPYRYKGLKYSSHLIIPEIVGYNRKILELGCGDGFITRQLLSQNNEVTGVDLAKSSPFSHERFRYFSDDLNQSKLVTFADPEGYDMIILADVIEHLQKPKSLIRTLETFLRPDSRLIVSTINIALFLYRLKLLLGSFDYSRKGIMDETHLKLYTEKTIVDFFNLLNYSLERIIPTSIPFSELLQDNILTKYSNSLYYRLLVKSAPKLFAYQFILVLKKNRATLTEEWKGEDRNDHGHL